MRYIVYGAGAIGGSIGARLFIRGQDVVLICRGRHLENIRRDGLDFRTPAESVKLPVPTVGHPSEIQFRGEDIVFLTMKSQDTAAALEDLQAAAGDVPVICAQNGVANENMALRLFSRVYAMLVVVPATYVEPGQVLLHASPVGGVLDAGCYPKGVDALIEQVTAVLTDSGFSARPDPQVMRLKYGKLLMNLANAVQALCGRDSSSEDIIRAARAEAVACYQAAGIDFATPKDIWQRAADVTQGEIEGHPHQGGSSWQSLARGSHSIEVDFLNGEITLLGSLYGIATPYNRMLQRMAKEAAREARPAGSFSVDILMSKARELEGTVEGPTAL